jgi:UDP-N-acetylglucosamine--N-acetylmuramyl-(pentapeptide) pyrophosphoryl-undecaprenol N-acetylglucosamine transferase
METSGAPHILLAGGGTGGHLYPGLALAAELRDVEPEVRVTFAGTGEGLDDRLVPAAGWPLLTLAAGRGSPFSWRRPLNLLRFGRALLQCLLAFRRDPPDVVVSLGGFAAAPAGLVAQLYGIPLVALEQNVIPGRVTRLLARWAAEVHLQFGAAREHLQAAGEVLTTGSPLRPALKMLAAHNPLEGECLLVVGGSQGARRLNELVSAAAPQLVSFGVPLIHITGERDLALVQSAYEGIDPDSATVLPYAEEMAPLYFQTRVALARAGAGTAAELCAGGIPAILVPYPAARDDHQTANARVLAEAGAAVLVPEAELTPESLTALLAELWYDTERLQRMSRAMSSFARPEAGLVIAERVMALAAEEPA